MSVVVAEAVPQAVPTRSAGRRALSWLPAAATVLVTVAILLARGTAPADIVRYGLYVGWALMLPGTLVYRALRGRPHSLVDDLAMGTALGFVLELAAWTAFAAAGLQAYLWIWPAFVAGIFGALPGLRRFWRRPGGYRPAPPGWSWAVAGVATVLVAFLGTTSLTTTPVPRDSPHWYYLDGPYLLSLVGDAVHHFPLRSPQVASEPLDYHWFTYAHLASARLVSGVDTPIVYFRLGLPVICLVAVVLMAVAGWRVSGRPWVGALAAALMFVTAEFTTTDYELFGMIGRWVIAISPSLAYAWLSTIPLIVVGVDLVRHGGLPDVPFGRGRWVLLALFAAAAAGAKVTILFILLAGFAAVGAVELVRRRFPRNAAIAGAVVVTIIAVATVVIYRGSSGGFRLSPLQLVKTYLPDAPRSTQKELAVLGLLGGAYIVYLLARLAGIPVLAWLSWRRRAAWSTTEWFLLGATLAGIGGALVFWHVTWAEVYLLRSAWPFGVILSALGLAALVDRYRMTSRAVSVAVLTGVALAAAVVAFVLVTGLSKPGQGYGVVLPIYWAALATAVVAAAVVVIRRGAGTVVVLALVLLMGVPVTLREIVVRATDDTPESTFYAERVTPDGMATTDWIRANVPPETLLATNGHCPAGHSEQRSCLHLTFWLSAYSERRLLVGGWGYVPRSAVEAGKAGSWMGSLPFFDEPKLAANEAAFYRPTATGLADLRDRYGVGWLVVDRTVAWESPELRRFATMRFERGDYAIYELR